MKCEECRYRATVKTTKTQTRYNALSGNETTMRADEIVPACGKNIGMPIEVPIDRIACAEWKAVE